jgi:plasmid stabilization system protein ParE
MNYTYIYEPVAFAEYKEAIEWYNEKSEIATKNFIIEVKEKIESICANPLRYRNAYKYFREVSLKKYPYCIVYFVDEKEKKIIISSVYHHKRNPQKKYRK